MRAGALTISDRQMLMLIGGAALVGWLVLRNAGTVARTVTSGVVQAGGGVVAGAAEGIGTVFGIPETSMTQCQADMAAGRTWDASFSCPAGDFVKYLFGWGPTAGG